MNSAERASVITVRSATLSDVNAVATIERDSFTLPWSRSSFANLVQSPAVQFLVAVVGADVVGGYAVLLRATDTCELANLAVAREMRGHGIGRRLLNAAIDGARANAASDILLEVRASNYTAQALYASAGFREVARRRRYYDKPIEDALVLRLGLRGADHAVDAPAHQP